MAHGQTSANLSFLSAYGARGVALDNHPVVQLRIEHDAADGWYAGGFASPVRLAGRSGGQLIAYGGRALRIAPTLTLDAGASRSVFLRHGRFDYNEFHIGLALSRASARLFYAPAYYGAGRTLYLDLNSAYPLGENLTLAIHGGLLHPFGEYRGSARDSADLRLALATRVGDYHLQAGWQAASRAYLPGAGRAPALTAGISRAF